MHLTNLITAVDLHACGEPGRVITGGVMDVPGRTMFEKMKYFEKHRDDIRLRLLREPRGYPALCANIVDGLRASTASTPFFLSCSK